MHHVFFVRNVNGSQPWNAAGYTIARDTDSNLLGHAHGVDAMVTGSVRVLTLHGLSRLMNVTMKYK